MMSMELLGIDETADIVTIKTAYNQMLKEIRQGKIDSDTGGAGEGGEQELDILMRYQLEVDLKYAFQNIQ